MPLFGKGKREASSAGEGSYLEEKRVNKRKNSFFLSKTKRGVGDEITLQKQKEGGIFHFSSNQEGIFPLRGRRGAHLFRRMLKRKGLLPEGKKSSTYFPKAPKERKNFEGDSLAKRRGG